MTTLVVNIRKDPYDVYVGRAGQGQDGYFGNPFRVTAQFKRERSLEDFRRFFYDRLLRDPQFKRRVDELRGKRLG